MAGRAPGARGWTAVVTLAMVAGAAAVFLASAADGSPRPGASVAAAPAATFTATPEGARSGCVISPARRVEPLFLPRGAVITVTDAVRVSCSDPRPLHIALVIDASGDMAGDPLDSLRDALLDAVAAVDLSSSLEVGLVALGGRPQGGGSEILSYLTAEESRIVPAIRGLTASGEASLARGLGDAFVVLRSGRGGRAAEDLREVILLASGGVEQSGCEAVQSQARDIKAHGVLLVTACAGPSCERRCLSEAASPRYAFRRDSYGYVARLIADLKGLTGAFHPVEAARLVDELRPEVEYDAVNPGLLTGGRVDWTVAPFPSGGITATYRARALACGRYPLSRVVEMTLSYSSGRDDVIALDNPTLEVSCPEGTAVPTPSATLVATSTPMPSATAVASPTADREAWSLHLPWTGNAGCAVEARGLVDLALVVDVSGSMAAPMPPFPSRWDAARSFAVDTIAGLRAGDRVAVIAVAGQAMEVQALTGDLEGARTRVATGLPKAEGSRLDLGLAAAAGVFEASAASAHRVVALLTDGDLNQTPGDSLAARAEALRGQGVAVRVILFDPRADEGLWRLLAGRADFVGTFEPLWPQRLAGAVRCR